MKQVCSDCNYIGELIKPRKHTYKFPLSGFFLGVSYNLLVLMFVDEPAFDILSVIIFFFLVTLISGGYLLYDDLTSSKTKSEKPNKKSSLIFLILGIIMAVWGFLGLGGTIMASAFHEIPGPGIWFYFGLATTFLYYRDSITCPNCEKQNTMIPIEEPRAQAIIKEKNLTIPDDPDEPLEEPEAKLPWQSN